MVETVHGHRCKILGKRNSVLPNNSYRFAYYDYHL